MRVRDRVSRQRWQTSLLHAFRVIKGVRQLRSRQKRPVRQKRRRMIDLASISDKEAKRKLRFTIPELGRLAILLQIPDPFYARTNRVSAAMALAILLNRLAGTRALHDIATYFHVHESVVSAVVRALTMFLMNKWESLLTLNIPRIQHEAKRYAKATFDRCHSLDNCIGFIDGTNREIARPTALQQTFYSGHKHYHSIKFQSWSTPDGLISHIFGPVPGARHDGYMWQKSKVGSVMELYFSEYCLFADQGYSCNGHLLAPYPGNPYLLT